MDRYSIIDKIKTTETDKRFRVLLDVIEDDDLFSFKTILDNRLAPYKDDDTTVLHYAASYSAISILKYIINHKIININSKDGLGRTAIHLAILSGCVKCVDYLLKMGADVNIVANNGMSARSMAKDSRQFEILKIINTYRPKR